MKYIFSFLLLIPILAKAQDTTAPVISNFWTQDTVSIGVFSDFKSQIPSYSIIDDVDGDITAQAEIINEVNKDSLGYYNFTVSAKDLAQNTVSQSVVIQVIDTLKPNIFINGPKWYFVNFGDDLTDYGVTISDNYYAAEDLIVNVGGTFSSTWYQGRFCITYQAEDPSFNRSRVHHRVVCVELDSIECISLPGELCEDEGVRTGVSEHGFENLDIYPNPSKGHFSINKPVDLIEVYNTKSELTLTTNSQEFDLNESGIYFLKAKTTEGSTFTQKIVVE